MKLAAKSTLLFVLFVMLCPAFCLETGHCAAQDLDNVTISGRVTDQNSAVIPGAIVTATLVATKAGRRRWRPRRPNH